MPRGKHNNHLRGLNHHKWNGGVRESKRYREINVPGHPRADYAGYVGEHILVAEKALGKFLESNHPVHHVNNKSKDNRNCNLVICESSQYHDYLHFRLRAWQACGNANFRKCQFCKKYDDVSLLVQRKKISEVFAHQACSSAYQCARYHRQFDGKNRPYVKSGLYVGRHASRVAKRNKICP